MPTTNPRVNVTLSPSLDALVTRLAQLQRVSKSSVLRELLETAEPELAQVVALMEAASKAKTTAKKNLTADMRGAVHGYLAEVQALMERGGALVGDLVSEAEAVRGRRPSRKSSAGPARSGAGAARGRKDPPSSNRGVKS